MLYLKKGSHAPLTSTLEQGFVIHENEICANVHVQLLGDICLRFIMHNRDKKIYFYLETPDGLKKEVDTGSDNSVKNAVQSYRIDFPKAENACSLLFYFSDLLMSDGLCAFKFGTDDGEELLIGKYNIVKVRGEDISAYRQIFEKLDICEKSRLITAYDTFSKQSHGISRSTSFKGYTVLDIPEMLKVYGIIE